MWDKLTSGAYVTDYYVSTPSNTTYSAPVPRCTYPYQGPPSTLNARFGPSSSYPMKATLPAGALGWVYCQPPGAKVSTTSVWDRLDRRLLRHRLLPGHAEQDHVQPADTALLTSVVTA